MKSKNIIIILALAASAGLSQAADIYVIGNTAQAAAADDIRDVFLGEKQIVAGTKAVPMDNASLQKDFLDKVIKMDSAKYSNIWTKKGFRDGLNPPPVKSSDAEVVSAVKATPGAIGYVSSPPAGVKVIHKY
jgi:hypothetical protein